ncbi:MFS transporter [Acidianus brierleyi]|uniref:MFS transporter n=1 Tax=Acidianus brierleyi TaxID=41673 RepID=A0A2U9IF30_9CREN|nr:MFS transporter [Acidianus brierleyi]AWR94631.1 MFS transporter [Acidianus brierleyi]
MRLFIGQALVISGITELSLLYPVEVYDETKSILILGIVSMIFNAANAFGSYIWGNILDTIKRRKEFLFLLPISLIPCSILLFSGSIILGFIGYGLLGFVYAIDAPLYSILLLENFTFEELPKANIRLSQFTLAGNISGSLLAIFKPNFEIITFVFLIAFVSNVLFIRNVTGSITRDKTEERKEVKNKLYAILSFFSFNFAAEIFFTIYIPFNYIMGNPEYFIFASYALLYIVDEIFYYFSSKIIINREIYYIYLIIFIRAVISIGISILILSKLKIGMLSIPLFLSFGSIYPIYSASFFSVMFRNLKKNRGTIIGIFNAVEDIASILGSLTAGIIGNNLDNAYMAIFYSFILSAFLFANYLRKILASSV